MRRSGHLVANGNRRDLYQPKTVGTWLRNSSWHADAANVRNLTCHSQRKSITFFDWLFKITFSKFTQGEELHNNDVTGALCLKKPWPGMARTIYGAHGRFLETYYRPFRGLYFTGDGAIRHSDGYYQITGRMDDVINVSGHRLGTAEVENALVFILEIQSKKFQAVLLSIFSFLRASIRL